MLPDIQQAWQTVLAACVCGGSLADDDALMAIHNMRTQTVPAVRIPFLRGKQLFRDI